VNLAIVNVKILEPADHFGFMTPAEARLGMGAVGAADISDEVLQFTIDQNSFIVATLCNRNFGATHGFARQKVREIWRCLGEPCDCPDAASSRRLFLSHWPVREEDVESVQAGNSILDHYGWELEEHTGTLTVYGIAEPIIVVYWGGFRLPEEAPPVLKYAATLLVRQEQSDAQTQAMAGIRMIAHKEARIVYHQASATQAAARGGGGGGTTPAMEPVKNLLVPFRRNWI